MCPKTLILLAQSHNILCVWVQEFLWSKWHENSINTPVSLRRMSDDCNSRWSIRYVFKHKANPSLCFLRCRPSRTWQRSWRPLAPWSQSLVTCCAPSLPCLTSEHRPLHFQRRCCARARSATHAGNYSNWLVIYHFHLNFSFWSWSDNTQWQIDIFLKYIFDFIFFIYFVFLCFCG